MTTHRSLKVFVCLLLLNVWPLKCGSQDIVIWDDEEANSNRNSLTIRFNQDKGLLMSIMDALRGQKLLPMCSMVGCATNATQCVANGGKEMVNKMSVGDYTQAYFKSIFTMDKTFLSINCNKMLIPCCFSKTPNEKPSPGILSSLPFRVPSMPSMPSLPMPSQPTFLREFIASMPEMPAMSIFILSNICGGIGGGAGDVSCNQDE